MSSGTGSQMWTAFSGRSRGFASRAAHPAAARLSGDPSRPTVMARSTLSTSCGAEPDPASCAGGALCGGPLVPDEGRPTRRTLGAADPW